MRARLNIAAIFIAVGLGALTVILLYDPGALIPRPPYFHRIFMLFSLAALAMLFVLGLEDDLGEIDDTDGSSDRPIHWRAVGLAFLTSALASAVFIGATALVAYLIALLPNKRLKLASAEDSKEALHFARPHWSYAASGVPPCARGPGARSLSAAPLANRQ